MDYLSPNQQPQINAGAEGQPMMDANTDYVYGALGPYSDSTDSIVQFLEHKKVVGYKSICDNGNEGRWIIVQSTDTIYSAQGPFVFDVDQMLLNEDNWVTGITLQDNQLVEMKGLGTACFDFHTIGHYWVICKLTDSNEGQSFLAPATMIPSGSHIPAVEGDVYQASGSHIPQVEGDVYPAVLQGDMDYMSFEEIMALPAVGGDEEFLPGPQPIDVAGDCTDRGAETVPIIHETTATRMEIAVHGDDGLAAMMQVTHLETPQGDHAVLEQAEEQDYVGQSQCLEAIQNDLDVSFDDLHALLETGSDEFLQPDPQSVDSAGDSTNCRAAAVPTSHDATAAWMEIADSNGDEEFTPIYQFYGHDTTQEDHAVFEQAGAHWPAGESHTEWKGRQTAGAMVFSAANPGSSREPSRKRARTDEQSRSVLRESNVDILQPTPISAVVVGNAAETLEAPTLPKEAQIVKPPSPRSVLRSGPSVATSSNEAAAPGIVRTDTNGKEPLTPPVHGSFLETPQGDAALDQGAPSSGESQWVSPADNVADFSEDGEMEGQIAGEMVATTSTNSRECKPRRGRPRLQPKFKHHGVKRRLGGRTSFVAYFRPKDLPESDKTFVTVGEFTNESDSWDAFNLFAFVHEGEESCINMTDKDSIEMEAAFWGELPRVDLVAHLRLKGRGYFKSDILPPESLIPKYRNVKFRKNTRGIDKEKIRWFCDVLLGEGITDPNIGNGTKETSTYETAEEAAKEADRLMILKEGHMAWTNYSLTDYMTEAEKDQWDQTWIPLQDNPKKYLSTEKYNYSSD